MHDSKADAVSLDGWILTDERGLVVAMSEPAETLTGRTAREAVGRPLEELVRAAEGRPITTSVAPLRGVRGEIVGRVVSLGTMPGPPEAERLLAAVVESSTDAIVSKSLEGTIQTWNAAAERLFGYGEAEAVGRHITLIIPSERAQEEQEILERIRAGERVDHFETVRIRKDGRFVNVSLTISPVRDDAGRIVGASKIARDITERKQAEEKIQELVTELQEADRRKDEFLAMLAHELRNPMAPLSNMLELIKRAQGDGELIHQARSTMERQIRHLARLVDDLVDVSRITRGKLELRIERVELAPILRHAVEIARDQAEATHLRIETSLPAEPVYLDADPVRLGQVFGNVLNNACKYSEPGGHIEVSVVREGDEVLVRFRDEGIGIQADKLGSIFDMFVQVDQALERSRGGLGIGLTLVKQLVEMLGGTVTARSAGLGRGSEFVVRLPAAPERRRDRPRKSHLVVGGPRRILVVDDNRDSASSLTMLLGITGHETQSAHEGEEALAVAESFRPDVILLDIGLPRLNGYEVCRRIRVQAWARDVVMVAMTGWGQDSDRLRSREAGFDHHLVKPIDYDALSEILLHRPA